MKCPCGNCNGGNMSMGFMQKLQSIRDIVGYSLKITSAFRCPAHNAAVGGVSTSMHLAGRAADISCVLGGDKFKLIRTAISVGINGIGVASTYVHIDDRENPAVWHYPSK